MNPTRLFVLFVLLALGNISRAQSEAPIQLHPQNPHYFLYRGKAVALISSGEHYGAVLNADFDYHRYLATLEGERMNYTRLFGGSYVEMPVKSFSIQRNDLAPAPGKFIAPWARSETPGYAGGGNKFNLTRWNLEYFTRLHDFLKDAARRGIVVEIGLFSSQYGEVQWNLSPFNRANNVNQTPDIDWKKLNTPENGAILGFQESYVRKLVREANAYPNVIFEIANEPWSDRPAVLGVVNGYLWQGRDQFPNSVDLPDELTMAWQQQVVQWITSEESALPNKHLIAQDCCNFRFPMNRTIPGVSIVNFHYAYPEAVGLNYGLNVALSYDETGFLGREDDAYTRQAWNFMLSGGSVFNGLDYSFSVGHEDGSDSEPNGPGGGSAEFRRRLRVLSDFLGQFSLLDLRPDPGLVVHAQGVYTRVLSTAKGEWAMYVDGNGPAEIAVSLDAGQYAIEWVDVVTGKVKSSEKFQHGGGAKTLRTPDFEHGIAMQLTSVLVTH